MRVIAMFSGPCAAEALTARGSVFSHEFNWLERLSKLATSYLEIPPELRVKLREPWRMFQHGTGCP